MGMTVHSWCCKVKWRAVVGTSDVRVKPLGRHVKVGRAKVGFAMNPNPSHPFDNTNTEQ